MAHAAKAGLTLSGVHSAIGGNVDTEGLGEVAGGCAVATVGEGGPATAQSGLNPTITSNTTRAGILVAQAPHVADGHLQDFLSILYSNSQGDHPPSSMNGCM